MEGWMIGVAAAGGLSLISGLVVGAFKFGGWVGRVDSDRTAFKAFMEEIRGDIKKILERLQPLTVASKSPVQLTEFGQEVSRELKVKEWALGQAAPLLERARNLQEHEVYDLCEQHVQSRIDEDETLRDVIRAGAYQRGIDIEQVQRVYVIELRDELLRRIEE